MPLDYKCIGSRIKEVRQNEKMTQEQLAERLMVSVGYISQLERGISKVNLETLNKISEIFSCEICYLIDGTSSSNKNYLQSDILDCFSRLSSKQKQLLLEIAKSIEKYS